MKNAAFALLTTTLLICLTIFSTGCREVGEQTNRLMQGKDYGRRNKINLPENPQNGEMMPELIESAEVCLLSVTDDSGNVLMNGENAAVKDLPAKINAKLKQLNDNKSAVYLEAAANVKYDTVVQILTASRQAKVENAALVVLRNFPDGPNDDDFGFWIKLGVPDFLPPFGSNTPVVRPNPLFLLVAADKNGNLTLNREKMGTVSNTAELTARLTDVMKEREANGVFREDTNEVVKDIWIQAPRNISYGDVVKIVDAVKGGGGHPIYLQLDDLTM